MKTLFLFASILFPVLMAAHGPAYAQDKTLDAPYNPEQAEAVEYFLSDDEIFEIMADADEDFPAAPEETAPAAGAEDFDIMNNMAQDVQEMSAEDAAAEENETVLSAPEDTLAKDATAPDPAAVEKAQKNKRWWGRPY